MKFFSKNSNLGIVLKHGLPGNAQLGTATQPGVYARFKDGVVEINDEELIKMMLAHPGFNRDFIKVEDNVASADPWANQRVASEPAHRISEMDHGQPKRVTKDPINVTPELKALLMGMAQEMAVPMATALTKQMLPGAVEQVLKSLAEKGKEVEKTDASETATEKADSPKKGGRPKKVVDTVTE